MGILWDTMIIVYCIFLVKQPQLRSEMIRCGMYVIYSWYGVTLIITGDLTFGLL